MKNLIYKIKNKFFRISKEGSKLKKPSYEELLKYQNFERNINNKLAFSFGAGRSGQNWFSKIFNSHKNWIGSCERFADYEAFYRYVCYYNLPIYKDQFFKLIELSSNRDMEKYKNSFIASPYLSFGIKELTEKIKKNYIFFNIRNPIFTVESLHKKGWYLNFDIKKKVKSPLIDISNSLYRSFSRIVPKDEFLDEWLLLTRVGKIAWFWSIANKMIKDDFDKIENTEKIYVRLEDINQNYDLYEILSKRFNFENKMNQNQFYDVINKAPNKGSSDKYLYKSWSDIEKKEFENIINKEFPYYDQIKTNI